MKEKLRFVAVLLLPIMFLGMWIGVIQTKINNAQDFVIAVEGYDPRDLLQGHYLRLRLNWQATDCTQFKDKLCHPDQFDHSYNFYLDEEAAKFLDAALWLNSTIKLHLVFAYTDDNKTFLKNMLINGQDWKIWLRKNAKKN